MLKELKVIRRGGFTLTEMLVVIAIVVLLATMVLPAFTEMLQSNRASAAKSLVRTMLARAQAHAVAHQKYAGIRFQFDRDGWQQGRQYMVLIEKASAGGTTNEYNAVADVKTVTLPKGVGVLSNNAVDIGDMDFSNNNLDEDLLSLEADADGGLLDSTSFSIIFSPTGQLVIKMLEIRERNLNDTLFGDEIAVLTDPVLVTDPPAPLLFHDNTTDPPSYPVLTDSVGWCSTESSATGFYVFEVGAMADVGVGSRYSQYVNDLEPFLVNRYTAGLIDE